MIAALACSCLLAAAEVAPDALHVTEGALGADATTIVVATPRLRADLPGSPMGATLRVERAEAMYVGAKPLGSGRELAQIGLLFCHADPCNTHAVMVSGDSAGIWRLKIQRKSNAGQSRSAECENRGYSEIVVRPLADFDVTAGFTISATMIEGVARVAFRADGVETVERFEVPDCAAGVTVRSDNMAWRGRISPEPTP